MCYEIIFIEFHNYYSFSKARNISDFSSKFNHMDRFWLNNFLLMEKSDKINKHKQHDNGCLSFVNLQPMNTRRKIKEKYNQEFTIACLCDIYSFDPKIRRRE